MAVNGREQAKVDAAIARLKTDVPEGNFVAAAGDLGTAEGAKKVTDAVPECDVLVNNTGIFEQKNFFDIPDEDWERLFQVNVMSGVRLSRFVSISRNISLENDLFYYSPGFSDLLLAVPAVHAEDGRKEVGPCHFH